MNEHQRTMYRAAWAERQNDGSSATLYEGPFDEEEPARRVCDQVRQLAYVEDAWIESAQWNRVHE